MSTVTACLIAAAALGSSQLALRGELGAQVRRNFAETFPVFVLLAAIAVASGTQADAVQGGALLYLAGRVAYLVLSARPLRPVRKFAWALSIAGLIGLAVGLVGTLVGR